MKSTILIVDDEEIGRECLGTLLSEKDYDLFFACNGQEALEKAIELKPDLILLDVMMPEVDGFQVCRHIRENPSLKDIPVILVTALYGQRSLIEGIEAGADDFICKPYNIEEILARIKTVTKLNRYRRLHQERRKFEWVVEQSDDGYLILNDKEEIIYANPRARHYLQAGSQNITETFLELAKRNYSLEPGEAWSTWPATLVPRYLLRQETENSPVFWLEVDLIEMFSTMEGYLVRLRNVTEQVVSRKNVWTFHHLVEHKLRTPLTSLQTILEILKMEWKNLSSQEIDNFFDEANKVSSRLSDQIIAILDSIKSREVLTPGLDKCSIAGISTAVDELKDDLELKSVNISYTGFNKEDDMYISFSLPAMEMILGELFENAKKFHPHNSPSIEINISSAPSCIYFKVCDDGLTLSPEQLSEMWIPYNQAEKYFTGEVPGMGLGLSTVASMVWSAGGKCKSYNRQEGPGIIIEIMFKRNM